MDSLNSPPMYGAPTPVSFPARSFDSIVRSSSVANNSAISDDPLYEFSWDSEGNFIWPLLLLYTAVANRNRVITLLCLKVRILSPYISFATLTTLSVSH